MTTSIVKLLGIAGNRKCSNCLYSGGNVARGWSGSTRRGNPMWPNDAITNGVHSIFQSVPDDVVSPMIVPAWLTGNSIWAAKQTNQADSLEVIKTRQVASLL